MIVQAGGHLEGQPSVERWRVGPFLASSLGRVYDGGRGGRGGIGGAHRCRDGELARVRLKRRAGRVR